MNTLTGQVNLFRNREIRAEDLRFSFFEQVNCWSNRNVGRLAGWKIPGRVHEVQIAGFFASQRTSLDVTNYSI